MNSRQLLWILSGDKFTKLSFRGVYAIDEMKSIKPGSHWVAVYCDKNGVGKYFDSFACYPPHEVIQFLCSHAKGWQYNRMQVQELYTTTCEQFVVFTSIKRVKD